MHIIFGLYMFPDQPLPGTYSTITYVGFILGKGETLSVPATGKEIHSLKTTQVARRAPLFPRKKKVVQSAQLKQIDFFCVYNPRK